MLTPAAKVLDRGDKIELLVDKSEQLKSVASVRSVLLELDAKTDTTYLCSLDDRPAQLSVCRVRPVE
jgi:hypothetical protein